MFELAGDHRAQRSAVRVDDAHGRHRTAAAEQVAEQAEDDQRRAEHERQRAVVATELLQQAPGYGADSVTAHSGAGSDRRRKASSSRWTRALDISSPTVPSASSLPARIRPSRSHRSASSMTWLLTRIEVPAAALLLK